MSLPEPIPPRAAHQPATTASTAPRKLHLLISRTATRCSADMFISGQHIRITATDLGATLQIRETDSEPTILTPSVDEIDALLGALIEARDLLQRARRVKS